MRSLLLGILATTLCTQAVCAQGAYQSGVGTTKCSQFTQQFRDNPNVETVYTSWALGYLTALNFFAMTEAKGFYADIGSMSVENMQLFIQQYCDANPLDDYAQAVMKVFGNLKKVRCGDLITCITISTPH